jgi:hypothetical protein
VFRTGGERFSTSEEYDQEYHRHCRVGEKLDSIPVDKIINRNHKKHRYEDGEEVPHRHALLYEHTLEGFVRAKFATGIHFLPSHKGTMNWIRSSENLSPCMT